MIIPFRRDQHTIKKIFIFCTFLLILSAPSWGIIPNIPDQLTIIDHKQNSYFATCPTFAQNYKTTYEGHSMNETEIPSEFSLLNWNIYKQQNKQWATALIEWAKQADLITLQEVKYSTHFIKLARQHQLHHLHNIAFIYQDTLYGVNTLSKTYPTQVCGTRYAEPWSIIPKTGLATTYKIQGSTHPLLLINLHGVNFTFTAEPLKEQITPYIQLIKQYKGPVIITGDFNTWTDARLEEVVLTLTTLGFIATQFSDDHRLTTFGLPLDHVFYRKLHLIDAQSIPTNASDHSPQLVRFSVTNDKEY